MSTETERFDQLTVRKGPEPGRVYPLTADLIVVGRDPTADLSLDDPEVSRQHVRLRRTPSGYVLEDLGSTNGTFIDGVQMSSGSSVPLASGQLISMGSGVDLLYEANEPKAAAVPAAPAYVPAAQPAPEPAPQPAQQWTSDVPLVPSAKGNKRSRRRTLTIALVALLLLCCCCVATLWSAYFYWGDPLMELLGMY